MYICVLGPAVGVEKPPLAPKPKFIPLEKAVPQALNPDCTSPPINTVKPARVSQPCLSKPPTPEWKPVSVFTSDYQSHFQQEVDNDQGLLHPRTKYKYDIHSGQVSASTPYNIPEFSGNQLKAMQVTHNQSQGTMKTNLNLINGSVASERNATSIPPVPQISSPTGLHPKSAESKPVLLNLTQRRHSAGEQNGRLTSILLPVQKDSPVPVQSKPHSTHVRPPEKPVRPKYNALTVKESTLAAVYKEGKTHRKQAKSEKKSRSRLDIQNDNVELLGNYPRWKVHSSEPKTIPDVLSDTRSEGRRGKQSGITLKPKVKSLTQADLNQSDGQRKSSFKKLKDFEFSVKKLPKLFSKGGQGPEITTAKDELSVDEGWHGTRNQNKSQSQIPQYRTHVVRVHHEEFTVEHNVDGDDVDNEHVFEDVTEDINACISKSPGIQTPQNATIWQRNISNKDEGINGKMQDHGEHNTRVRQDYNER